MTAPQQQQQLGTDLCPVCLAPMVKGAALFQTACGHKFHFACIKDSVERGFTCPLCRADVPQLAPAPAPAPAPAFGAAPPPFAMMQQQTPMIQQQQQMVAPPWAPHRAARGPVPMMHHHHAMSPFPFPGQQQQQQQHHQGTVPADEELPPAEAAEDVAMEDEGGSGEDAKLRLEATTEVRELLFSEAAAALFGMVSVVAPASTKAGGSRGSVDIVAVVDVSGSMSGAKIDLLKLSLKYMITQLGQRDRFSIVSFSHNAACVCGLRRITQEGGREVEMLVDTLRAGGGTDIYAGLKLGLDVLRKRKHRNPVCTLLLLTDGQDSGALHPAREALREGAPDRVDGVSIHTFGFGRDHDAEVCSQIAHLGKGVFNYIESTDELGPAFATAIGGLLTVAAQAIKVVVAPGPGITLTKVHTQFQTKRVAGDRIEVEIPDIYQGERRDLLVELSVPAIAAAQSEPYPLAAVDLMYAAAPTFDRANLAHANAEMHCLRVLKVVDGSHNLEIEVQRLRIGSADAMDRAIALARTGKNAEAKTLLLEQKQRIQHSASARHPLCEGIIADLDQCIHRVEPREFASGGWAAMQSMQVQQAMQRVSTASPAARVYSTPAQCMQQAAWSSYSASQQKHSQTPHKQTS